MSDLHQQYFPDANWSLIPDHMQASVLRWILKGEPVGDFLTSFLKNDLMKACVLADDKNLLRLRDFVHFFHNYAPFNCYGSTKWVDAWRKMGGLEGREKQKHTREEKEAL